MRPGPRPAGASPGRAGGPAGPNWQPPRSACSSPRSRCTATQDLTQRLRSWPAVSVAAIAYLRMLVPAIDRSEIREVQPWVQTTSSFLGVWRKRVALQDATARMTSYDAELRPALQHLLAAGWRSGTA